MQQTEFIETIRERAGLDSNEESETVTVATLQTLGTRISEGQLQNVAEQLPDGLAGVFSAGTEQATDLTAEEFLKRVENEESDARIESDTEEHVRTVLSAVATAEFPVSGTIDVQNGRSTPFDIVL